MLNLALPGAVARVVEISGDHFSALPNGALINELDLLAVLVLAIQGSDGEYPDSKVVAAKNRLVRLGLGSNVSLTYPEKMALYALAAWRLAQERHLVFADNVRNLSLVEPRQLVRECWQRCLALWNLILVRQEAIDRDCEDLTLRLKLVIPLGLSLMKHQLEAVLLAERAEFHFLLEDDMGLGKTIEILGAMALLGNDAFPALIASPLSVSYKWEREVKKWLALFRPTVLELTSSMDWTKAKQLRKDGRNIVFRGSWQQLIIHQKQLRGFGLQSVVGDESHYLANWNSQRTRAFMRIRTEAALVLEATGTMMPNGRHREAYAQIKALDSNAFRFLGNPGVDEYGGARGDWKLFARRYCDPQVSCLGENKITKYDGRSNEVEFGQMLARYSIRRTKAEVFGTDGSNDLHVKTRYILPIQLSKQDQLCLARNRDQVRTKLQKKARCLEQELREKGLRDELIAEKVKRILSSEVVSQLAEMRLQVGLLKARHYKVRISELVAEGHRVVVFCEHYRVADAAYEVFCKSLGKDEVLLGKGNLTGAKRQKLIDQGEGGIGSVIILTKAFREGLDLCSYDWLTMLERWWVPGHECQAEDRIYRIGQTKPVGIDFPMIPGSSDDAMVELQVWKEQGQQQVCGSAESRAYEWIMKENTDEC